jgi:hypothetical protein
MPKAICLLLNAKLNSQSCEVDNHTSEITLETGDVENEDSLANDLDSKVKQG